MTNNYSLPHKIIDAKCERLTMKYALTFEIEKMARTTDQSFCSLEFRNVESHPSSYK